MKLNSASSDTKGQWKKIMAASTDTRILSWLKYLGVARSLHPPQDSPFAAMDTPSDPVYASSPPSTIGSDSPRPDSLVHPRHDSSISAVNPFSPPPSVHSFSSPSHTPLCSPVPATATGADASYFVDARSPVHRFSSGSIRPAGGNTSPRETFTSPPSRPLTMLSTSVPPLTRAAAPRAKSTLLTDNAVIEKPWLEKRDPLAMVAYCITYGIFFLGVIIGGVRCYLDWTHVAVMKGNLCPVMDESFDGGDSGIFGNDGFFFREVDMSGFGYGHFFHAQDFCGLTLVSAMASSR